MSLYLPFFQVPSSLPVQQPFSACFLSPSPPFPRSLARAYTILRALAFLVPVSSTVLTLLLSFHYLRRASPVPHQVPTPSSSLPVQQAFGARFLGSLPRPTLLLPFHYLCRVSDVSLYTCPCSSNSRPAILFSARFLSPCPPFPRPR